MERTCGEHGRTRTRIWPDAEHYRWLQSLALPKTPPRANCAAPLVFTSMPQKPLSRPMRMISGKSLRQVGSPPVMLESAVRHRPVPRARPARRR